MNINYNFISLVLIIAITTTLTGCFGNNQDNEEKPDKPNVYPVCSDSLQNLGAPIRLAADISAGNVGTGVDGEPVLYAIVRGHPLQFYIIDIKSGNIIKRFTLKNLYDSTAGAVVVASDSSVYIGTRGNAHLYKYVPGSDHLTNLGQPVSGESVLFRLVPGKNGVIYGSTYPGGHFFKYDPQAQQHVSDYGQAAPGERYGRSIGYDSDTNKLFIGTGTSAKLIEYNLDTGQKTDITDVFSNKGDANKAFNVKVVAGHLFVELNKGGGSYIINIDDIGPGAAQKVSFSEFPSAPLPGDSSKVLINSGHTLATFDLSTYNVHKLTKSVGLILQGKFVRLDDSAWPGYTYVAALYDQSKMLKYNLQTSTTKIVPLSLKGAATNITSMNEGPNGKIYIGGTKNGLAVYSPQTGNPIKHGDIGQVEGIGSMDGKIYFGNYTSARVLVYNPDLPWGGSGKSGNPHQLFSIGQGQDRPFVLVGDKQEHKLFIGTVPTYGELNGAFSVYNVDSKKLNVHKGIIPNQSIISLVFANGKVYGGSSIKGGLGVSPVAEQARLFVWDPQGGEKVYETVPLSNGKAITSLITGPDGKIWGLDDGTLFIFDPDTRQVNYTDKLSDDTDFLTWRGGYLKQVVDGNIYSTVGGNVFRINPETKQVTKLINGNYVFLARDDNGHLYFRAGNKTDMMQYCISN